METALTEIIRDSVGLGILALVLLGIYRLAARIVGLIEIGLARFLDDFERMSDGITSLANTQRNNRTSRSGASSNS